MAAAKKPVEVVIKNAKKVVEPKIETPKAPKGYIIATGGKYICKKKCYFGISLYKEGAVYEAEKGEIIPKHFQKAKRFVEVED